MFTNTKKRGISNKALLLLFCWNIDFKPSIAGYYRQRLYLPERRKQTRRKERTSAITSVLTRGGGPTTAGKV